MASESEEILTLEDLIRNEGLNLPDIGASSASEPSAPSEETDEVLDSIPLEIDDEESLQPLKVELLDPTPLGGNDEATGMLTEEEMLNMLISLTEFEGRGRSLTREEVISIAEVLLVNFEPVPLFSSSFQSLPPPPL